MKVLLRTERWEIWKSIAAWNVRRSRVIRPNVRTACRWVDEYGAMVEWQWQGKSQDREINCPRHTLSIRKFRGQNQDLRDEIGRLKRIYQIWDASACQGKALKWILTVWSPMVTICTRLHSPRWIIKLNKDCCSKQHQLNGVCGRDGLYSTNLTVFVVGTDCIALTYRYLR